MGRPATALTSTQRQFLCRLYDEQPLSYDQLGYAGEFFALYARFVAATSVVLSENCLWRALGNLRRVKGGLPGKTKRPNRFPFTPGENAILIRLCDAVPRAAGIVDHMVCTPWFEEVYRKFIAETKKPYDRNIVWRKSVDLRKSGRLKNLKDK